MRKVCLTILLILMILGCYGVIFGKSEIIRNKVASMNQLKLASQKLNGQIAELERNSTEGFTQKKNQLAKTIEEYNTTKQQYEQVVSQLSEETAQSLIGIQENDLKDIYDVSFLWTILGNYATEEGVDLDLDILKNITSVSSLNNTSSNYIVCDLKFTLTGKYINLTSFIYDIEDDDRLSFEINNFDMKKSEADLQVTLTVKEIKLNADNLIEASANSNFNTTVAPETQTIDSNTTTTRNNVN